MAKTSTLFSCIKLSTVLASFMAFVLKTAKPLLEVTTTNNTFLISRCVVYSPPASPSRVGSRKILQ
jgi:hypothetical protein